MTPPYTFIPGLPATTGGDFGGGARLPAIVLPDGSCILLSGHDAACSPRQHQRRAKRLPTLETRNQIGAAMVEALNAKATT